MKTNAGILAKTSDAANLKKIGEAFAERRIDAETRDYLTMMYRNGAECFRNNFFFLGRTLGAPKTPIYVYDPAANTVSDKELEISDVGPAGTYVVHHRFDNDPMRNQFFTFESSTEIRLLVSSIVSVIIAAQKNVARAIDKITGKYYDNYLGDILDVVEAVLSKHKKNASVAAVSDKITAAFRASFISNPAPEVLKIIGNMFPDISVDLVRELDGVDKPYERLNDVYRMKLLFDTVPQISAFIDYVRAAMPNRVIRVLNKFYDLDNSRNYRDAKIVVGFDSMGKTMPLEIIMNVRTFFDFERQSHAGYETMRKKSGRAGGAAAVNELHHSGIASYNAIICKSVQYLLHRVGWNIMYEKDMKTNTFFRGFPKIAELPYERKIVDAILEKMDDCVRNEIFRLPYVPRQLSEQEEISVFRYITEFILFSALPYAWKFEEIKTMGFSGKVFNFVMKELYRYYENDVL